MGGGTSKKTEPNRTDSTANPDKVKVIEQMDEIYLKSLDEVEQGFRLVLESLDNVFIYLLNYQL